MIQTRFVNGTDLEENGDFRGGEVKTFYGVMREKISGFPMGWE